MLTWEQTIEYIRTQSEYKVLVEKAYFEEDLILNINRFRASEEYEETLNVFDKYAHGAESVLDVGSGNGISAVSFALKGYQVTACEPDPSLTIGAGAIRKLKNHFQLENLEVLESFAEELKQKNKLFDIIYIRQAMHHAYDLNKFIFNLSSLLKQGGLFLTVRDHVIYNANDKKRFLENHPLHKYYGGENAFTQTEYLEAFRKANLTVKCILKYYDSVINYFPLTKFQFIHGALQYEKGMEKKLAAKLGIIGKLGIVKTLYKMKVGFRSEAFYDEVKIPGRMYSFITIKK